MLLILSLLSISVVILLLAERIIEQSANIKGGRVSYLSAGCKLIASSLFVFYFYNEAIGVNLQLQLSSFDVLIFTAFVLSLIGDGLLIPKSRSYYFLAGIGAFALAHIAFSSAFLLLRPDTIIVIVSLLSASVAGIFIYIWLKPYLKNKYRLVVPAYLLIIALMVVTGVSGGLSNNNYWLASGSVLFALSDIFVARNRFIVSSFINRLIGLPLYYIAQMMIAYGAITLIQA